MQNYKVHGYNSYNNYCVAKTDNAKFIMPRTGQQCPQGYTADNKYCVEK